MLKVPAVAPKAYPAEFIMTAMMLMGNGVPASQVTANVVSIFEGTGKLGDPTRYNWPDQTTYRRWRYGMEHICRVQIGMELTKAAHDKRQVLTGDGTPVNGKHVESFIITTSDVKIAMIPWVQAGKGSELSAHNTVKKLNLCQRANNGWYVKCKDKAGLPVPVQLGSLILNVLGAINDMAPNEIKRVGCLSNIKKRLAVQIFGEEVQASDLISFKCNGHKGMLLAKALRKADHDVFILLFPDRDKGEFRTNNILDMFQIQLAKMFGHHAQSYAFGNGIDKFPAWMKNKYPDRWRGFKRLVGNRANIFLENAVSMYYMSTFYLEYCNFILREAKKANSMHRRLDEKLRSAEVMAGSPRLLCVCLLVHVCLCVCHLT